LNGALVLFVVATSTAPAVLLEPEEARTHADRIAASEPLRAAEIHMLAGGAQRALEILARLPPIDLAREGAEDEAARRIRIEADAYLAMHDEENAVRAMVALSRIPGWHAHGSRRRQPPPDQISPFRRALADTGVALFALSAGLLLIGAARELLRVRLETVLLAFAAAIAVLLASRTSPALAAPVGLVSFAAFVLGHAGAAAVARRLPGPRGRLLFGTLVVLGIGGASVAALSSAPVRVLLAAFGR
jgi:hypothetical protein